MNRPMKGSSFSQFREKPKVFHSLGLSSEAFWIVKLFFFNFTLSISFSGPEELIVPNQLLFPLESFENEFFLTPTR